MTETETKTKPIVTYDKALEILTDLAKANPDYVYRPETLIGNGQRNGPCENFDDEGNPSCIVGHVLHRLGYTPDTVQEVGIAAAIFDGDVWTDGDQRTRALLRVAQDQQDNGETWGKAVERATAYAAGMDV